ncbi:polysaccharide lyase [Chryseobacterium sp. Mn2064]|uniref:polysaccharide lyase n=1 Tax=Chryseobacterium sp. Mn2064 TaxID=3395263 RepID=UPI003BDE866C
MAFFSFMLIGCDKEGELSLNQDEFVVDNDMILKPMAIASKVVNFNRADGIYTKAQAESDFGGSILNNWQNIDIYSNQARVRIPANTLSSGNIVNIDVADGTEYELSFKVRFGPNFDWSRGGKVGFGFHIGNGYTGCNKADNGLGGTARLMWYNETGTKTNFVTTGTYFRPYVYYRDMPQTCGDSFGKQSQQLSKNTWYTVKIRVKSNSGSDTNGLVLYEVDGVNLLSQSIRWTTDDNYRKIRYITFHTFRGGSQEYWQSTTDGFIYYDDLSFTRISS